MRRFLLASVAALSAATIASAADIPVSEPAPVVAPLPAYSWTGFYVGAHGGYSFGEHDGNVLDFRQ